MFEEVSWLVLAVVLPAGGAAQLSMVGTSWQHVCADFITDLPLCFVAAAAAAAATFACRWAGDAACAVVGCAHSSVSDDTLSAAGPAVSTLLLLSLACCLQAAGAAYRQEVDPEACVGCP
jgi:hypothetical protein